jgi:hypothetical protein
VAPAPAIIFETFKVVPLFPKTADPLISLAAAPMSERCVTRRMIASTAEKQSPWFRRRIGLPSRTVLKIIMISFRAAG